MTEAEEYKIIELKYSMWLREHIKGDHSYKSFSHMSRIKQFAKFYKDQQIAEALEQIENIIKGDGSVSERMEEITKFINKR